MAAGDPSAAAAGDVSPVTSFSPSPTSYASSLRGALATLSQAFDSGDTEACDAAATAVSEVLDAAAAAAMEAADGGDGEEASRSDTAARASEELLREVYAFLSCPSSNQMAIEGLSLVLPKPVAKLGALVLSCRDTAAAIIKFFVTNCSPRDMLCILCEVCYAFMSSSIGIAGYIYAVDIPMELPDGPAYFVLLLNGLAEVLTLIQRRHIEQVKVALPAVLKVIHATVSECDEDHGEASIDIFNAALGIGNSIQEMCKVRVNMNRDLCAILGLYSLQNIALISQSKQHDTVSACGSVALQYSQFLKFSGFTYVGILTGDDVTAATFLWTYVYDDLSKYAGEGLELALKEVQDNHMKKWEAIGMLKYVLSSFRYPWVFKSHCINLLLTLAVENGSEEINDVDFTSYAACVFATLKVISMVPSSQRFDILHALINNSMSHSLTAILLDIVRDEVLRESRHFDKDCADGLNHGESPPWASHALDLVELILRPPEDGPPCLPDQSEQVYFFLMIDCA
ncbi:hypothetical protein PR202_gb03542 [Eleusine coracana subsp. coracana]|uniref:Aberrant root formation protein 4 n=1 Tax=Eleusine coracana subsp. coracana TaxID=191504 RepID=A0AAV5E246_ELECO|nr:hypothetical protein PR202_gb03542 [Eleusine coracana subsp. coracana]